MSNPMSLAYYSSELGEAAPYELVLAFEGQVAASGVPGIKQVPANNATLLAWTDAAGPAVYFNHPTQDEINVFLGTTNEFTPTPFDSTVIAATTDLAMIVNMEGQAAQVVGVTVNYLDSLAASGISVAKEGALTTGGALTVTHVELGADGNIAVQVKAAASVVNVAGTLVIVKILWLPK